MKKILLILILLLGLFVISCEEKNPPVENKIVLSKEGKKDYFVGESFEHKGFYLQVTINGEEKEVELLNSMYEPITFTKAGQFDIDVTYEENDVRLSLAIKVNVSEKEKNLKSISISQKGKTNYKIGESFDVQGYKLKIEYTNDEFDEIELTNEMININKPFDKEGLNTITISYTYENITKECQLDVTVEGIKVIKLEVVSLGKDYYTYEYEFDLTGYVFEATYSDGTKKIVDIDINNCYPITFEENVTDEIIETNVTIKYTEKNVTVETIVKVKVLSEWDYEEYVGLLEAEKMIDKIYLDVDAIIPDELTENLILPDPTTYGYKYPLIFTSSDYDILSSTGTINRSDDDKTVTLTLTIKNSYLTKSFSWDIVIKGLGPVKLRPWNDNDKHVFAYFYEGTSQYMSEADARKVDVINYCFGRVNNGVCDISSLKYFTENLKLRRSTGVRVVLSIGGGGKENYGFSDACIDAASRKKFIDSMMDLLKKYQFDGFDIDWEYPGWTGLQDSKPVDKANFTLLLKELRETLDSYKEGLLLTAALIGGNNGNQYYEVEEINKYLDYAHIMTYDLNNSGVASHHCNTFKGSRAYSAKSAMEAYANFGMDYKKMIIGVAFYGKISKLTTPTTPENALNKPVDDTTTIHYTTIYQTYMKDSSYKKIYDESTGAYYLSNGEYFITYDDPKAIELKCDLIKQNNLGGIMFWDYGSDTTGTLLKEVAYGISVINSGR